MRITSRTYIELEEQTNYLICGFWSSTMSYKLSDAGIPVVKVADSTSLGYSVYSLIVNSSTIGASPDGSGRSQWKLVESVDFIYMQDAYIENLKTGRFESNKDGNRIVIDPEKQGMFMYDELNREVFSLQWYSSIVRMTFRVFHTNDRVKKSVSFDTTVGFIVQEYSTSGNYLSEIRYGADGAIVNSKLLNISDAVAEATLMSGQWYRTGNVVKVKG